MFHFVSLLDPNITSSHSNHFELGVSPSHQSVPMNAAIKINCISFGKVFWLHNGKPFSAISHSYDLNHYIFIDQVNYDKTGLYKCVGKTENTIPIEATSTVSISSGNWMIPTIATGNRCLISNHNNYLYITITNVKGKDNPDTFFKYINSAPILTPLESLWSISIKLKQFHKVWFISNTKIKQCVIWFGTYCCLSKVSFIMYMYNIILYIYIHTHNT